VSGTPAVPDGAFLMALADVLAHDPSPDLQARGAQLQNLMPTYTPPPVMGDVEMDNRVRADRSVSAVSAKAWGKQPAGSNVSSRKSSFSQPPPSTQRSESSTTSDPLFTSGKEPMRFFVQVGYPRRADLVTSIKVGACFPCLSDLQL
jgi:hypothetical protein